MEINMISYHYIYSSYFMYCACKVDVLILHFSPYVSLKMAIYR